ncbi:MAG: hypothetical protein P0Y64_18085 [Candidatus Sphingomonas colombiensis]|nr:hypothetical protein [Sphingomonas sp.]WEK43207.1 MAG: hypothetical protein P0Y64_18085 [Sphingomonas sp.]
MLIGLTGYVGQLLARQSGIADRAKQHRLLLAARQTFDCGHRVPYGNHIFRGRRWAGTGCGEEQE